MQFCILFIVAFSLVAVDLFPYREVEIASVKLLAVMLLHCFVVVIAGLFAWYSRRGMDERQAPRTHDVEKFMELHVGLWSVVSICSFVSFDLSRLLQGSEIALTTPVVRLLSLLSTVLPLLVSWALLFDSELIRHCGSKVESRWSFVWDNAKRFLLLPSVLLLGIAIWSDGIESVSADHNVATNVLRFLPLPLIAMAFPFLLRLSQASQRLPASSLRDRIRDRCQKANYVPSEVLVWNTEQTSRNAALAGLFSWHSYLLLTDRLVKDLPAKRVESIVLHELAHARYAHHWKLLLTIVVLCAGCVSLYEVSADIWSPTVALTVTIVPMAFALATFSKLARLFELEADRWAANESGDPLEYLRAIADVASGDPDQATWMHPSFQTRCEFLLNEVEKKGALLRLEMQTVVFRLVVWVCIVTAVATILTFAW